VYLRRLAARYPFVIPSYSRNIYFTVLFSPTQLLRFRGLTLAPPVLSASVLFNSSTSLTSVSRSIRHFVPLLSESLYRFARLVRHFIPLLSESLYHFARLGGDSASLLPLLGPQLDSASVLSISASQN